MSDKDYKEYEDTFEDTDEEILDEFDDSSQLIDDEWEDSAEDDSVSYQDAPKKKKGSFLTIILVVVVVFAVMGFAIYRFGGGDASAPEETVSDMAVVQPVSDGQAEAPMNIQVEPGIISSGQPADTAELPAPVDGAQFPAVDQSLDAETRFPPFPDQSGEEAASLQAPAPVSVDAPVADIPAENGASATENSVSKDVVTLQPVSDFPSVDAIRKVETPADVTAGTAPVAPVPQVEVVESTPPTLVETPTVSDNTAMQAASGGDAGLKIAQDRISELERSIEKEQAAKRQYAEEIAQLKGQISRLEADLSKSASSSKSAPMLAPEFSGQQASKKAPATSSAPRTVRSSGEKLAQPKQVAVTWVLKSAQPGRAILSRKGQGDYKTVSVGDRIQGLGTILSIDRAQNGWVVVGTSGRVAE